MTHVTDAGLRKGLKEIAPKHEHEIDGMKFGEIAEQVISLSPLPFSLSLLFPPVDPHIRHTDLPTNQHTTQPNHQRQRRHRYHQGLAVFKAQDPGARVYF